VILHLLGLVGHNAQKIMKDCIGHPVLGRHQLLQHHGHLPRLSYLHWNFGDIPLVLAQNDKDLMALGTIPMGIVLMGTPPMEITLPMADRTLPMVLTLRKRLITLFSPY
jgi:hypothetical protein